MNRQVLVCRLDNIGDVVLTGPAVRAIASRADVTMLTSSVGADAAQLLPGVTDVVVFDAPWVGYEPTSVDSTAIDDLVTRLRRRSIDEAVIFTSFHQSSLPLALVLKLAGIGRITAISDDYPGALLDVRCTYEPQLHEVEQNLAVAHAAGFPPAPDDPLDLRLALGPPDRTVRQPPERYAVVHPGASVKARSLPDELARSVCAALVERGLDVIVTGSQRERDRARRLLADLGPNVHIADGQLSLTELCHVIGGATVLVAGNTGPVHLAAAMGTPIIEIFAPVVDPNRWRPWQVEHRLLGDQAIGCAGCRARICPLAEQACISGVTAGDVVAALDDLVTLEAVAAT